MSVRTQLDTDEYAGPQWSAQDLINTGQAWLLEGNIGRQCWDAIESGRAILGPTGHRNFWGGYVPSRDEVQPGTVGSIGYANAQREGWGEGPVTAAFFDQDA